jgi:hypothetical protein
MYLAVVSKTCIFGIDYQFDKFNFNGEESKYLFDIWILQSRHGK